MRATVAGINTCFSSLFEPCREIMELIVLRKLILQTRMCSHLVGLNIWVLVGLFVYFHTSCVRTAKAGETARMPKPSLVAYVIGNLMNWLNFSTCPNIYSEEETAV